MPFVYTSPPCLVVVAVVVGVIGWMPTRQRLAYSRCPNARSTRTRTRARARARARAQRAPHARASTTAPHAACVNVLPQCRVCRAVLWGGWGAGGAAEWTNANANGSWMFKTRLRRPTSLNQTNALQVDTIRCYARPHGGARRRANPAPRSSGGAAK